MAIPGTVSQVKGVTKKITDELPMDTASRMKRARDMGYNVDAYHGTRRDLTDFEGGDVGFHFGTQEQASKRLSGTRRDLGSEGENIIPARLKMENPLELPDVGQWNDPAIVANVIRKRGGGFGQKHQETLADIEDEANRLKPQFEDSDAWKESQEAADLLDEVRMLITDDGYDGVKYLNVVENKMGDVAGLTVEGQKTSNRLNKEYHELRKKIAQRDTPPPKANASKEELQRWLDRKHPEPTAAETKRFDEIAKENEQLRETSTYSPYSYITFDPANIRSRFAKFDPSKKTSANLLAGAAGGMLFAPAFMNNE
jgi:hypothetical protein